MLQTIVDALASNPVLLTGLLAGAAFSLLLATGSFSGADRPTATASARRVVISVTILYGLDNEVHPGYPNFSLPLHREDILSFRVWVVLNELPIYALTLGVVAMCLLLDHNRVFTYMYRLSKSID